MLAHPSLRVVDALHARLGPDVQLLDPGGSLAVPTVLALLVGHVEDHFRRAGRPVSRVLFEPGPANP